MTIADTDGLIRLIEKAKRKINLDKNNTSQAFYPTYLIAMLKACNRPNFGALDVIPILQASKVEDRRNYCRIFLALYKQLLKILKENNA